MKTTLTMKKNLLKIFILIPLFGFTQNPSVYITNEGNFGTGNGSLSVYDINLNTVTNDVFSTANGGALLGDVVQSMQFFNGNGYICVNNSSKIEVIDESANYIATIPVTFPRYIKQVNTSKAYATDWGANGVNVIDLNTNIITSTITCGTGPEGLAISNGYAYVCNVGGFGLDSTVTIINTSTDAVIATLTVGDKPNSAVVDKDGNVWILTGGFTEYDANWNIVSETPGVLAMINTVTNTIDRSYTFPIGNHPKDLIINSVGDKMYYSDGSWSKSVYEFGLLDTDLPTNKFIDRSFYGLGFDTYSNEIYATDAVDFIQQGWVYRYATSGAVIDSFLVGIIPGSFAFKHNALSSLNINHNEVSIYPNPTNGRFFISSNEKLKLLLIYDLLGVLVKSISVNYLSDIIDLNEFEKGVYIIDIISENGKTSKKLIIE